MSRDSSGQVGDTEVTWLHLREEGVPTLGCPDRVTDRPQARSLTWSGPRSFLEGRSGTISVEPGRKGVLLRLLVLGTLSEVTLCPKGVVCSEPLRGRGRSEDPGQGDEGEESRLDTPAGSEGDTEDRERTDTRDPLIPDSPLTSSPLSCSTPVCTCMGLVTRRGRRPEPAVVTPEAYTCRASGCRHERGRRRTPTDGPLRSGSVVVRSGRGSGFRDVLTAGTGSSPLVERGVHWNLDPACGVKWVVRPPSGEVGPSPGPTGTWCTGAPNPLAPAAFPPSATTTPTVTGRGSGPDAKHRPDRGVGGAISFRTLSVVVPSCLGFSLGLGVGRGPRSGAVLKFIKSLEVNGTERMCLPVTHPLVSPSQ